jgi:hypothetical protein
MPKPILTLLTALLLLPLVALNATGRVALWDVSKNVPRVSELPVLDGIKFQVINPYEFNKDGYRFLHGVAICFHKGWLYASFGHNKGGENTDTEEARYCVSKDDGKTWSEVRTIDAGDGAVGVSGAFLSHNRTLWAFHGANTGTMKGVHTRAYVLDETSQQWQPKGTVIEDGFYPGLHLLPDGTLVATTYTTYRKDDGGCSIVSVRLKMSEVDALAAKQTK